MIQKRLQNAVVTVVCFMVGVPMPPKAIRPLVAVVTLTNYPRLQGSGVPTIRLDLL